jgi:hypothetical protein
MKHTPGPWVIQTDNRGFYWIDKLTNDGGFSICNLGNVEEAKANAALIAAAPELLEACRDTLTRLEWWEEDRENRCIDNAFAVLKCAIAKAEGRE